MNYKNLNILVTILSKMHYRQYNFFSVMIEKLTSEELDYLEIKDKEIFEILFFKVPKGIIVVFTATYNGKIRLYEKFNEDELHIIDNFFI